MWFGGEIDHGCCRGQGTLVTEEGRREGKRNAQGTAYGKHFPRATDRENERS